jgi:hypothetical protein
MHRDQIVKTGPADTEGLGWCHALTTKTLVAGLKS